ncbi:MAG: ATP-dependent Clp protease ATP-binding subunit [Spirochaetaceae bacterium]|nr:ATP-dependent Clp protease ATP-binding subunit [Spirochaetaceae bacterium]
MAKSLSPRAHRLVTVFAQDEGKKSGSEQLLPEHIILAMLKSADGLGYILLQRLKVNVLNLQVNLEQSISPQKNYSGYADLPVSRRVRTLLDSASVESRTVRRDYIGTEHIVIAAAREEHSTMAAFFSKAGIQLEDIYHALSEVYEKFQSSFDVQRIKTAVGAVFNSLDQHSHSADVRNQRQGSSILTEFSRDLTELARTQQLDPVVGREAETRRLIQILSRRTKNNPVLVGEPGVGKTAIVEGLAQSIASGKVPRNLLRKRLLSLDLAAVVAGTKYRGEFEERIKRILKEITEKKNIILFIDELHTLIGAGGAEGSMDASNMLKPALARGELQCIGATTLAEYRKYFEKDAALERRFQKMLVEEPSDVDTMEILSGIKAKYEEFHGVSFQEDVIPSVVRLSRRYLTDRTLPDKAIDILDEAGAMKKIDEEERPAELDSLERDIANLMEEKNLLVQNQDYERAAEVRDKVRLLRGQLEIFRERWEKGLDGKRKIVTVQDICSVISGMTGIPSEQLSTSELDKLLTMEQELHKEVIGQHEAVSAISSAVRRSRTGVSSNKRPAGSFIFLGPTGVGKTLLAKTLAKFLFGSEDALIRVDMSDFMEKHNSSRLVGAPPGYVGFEEGGVLTEKVRLKPYSVVLLDEIEKAHPDVFNLLLQILEEGELTDNLGHKVNFRNTVIIMTSNAGIREITSGNKLGFSSTSDTMPSYDEIKASALAELKKILSPELLNRIDDTIVFTSLSRKEVASILDLQLSELKERLIEQGLYFSITNTARTYLIDNGFDPSYGARPMRRLIQKEIEDQIALKLIEFAKGNKGNTANATVNVSCSGGSLKVSLKKTQQVNSLPKVEKKLIANVTECTSTF